MRLKFLVVAAIVAISFLGFNLPAANAQPGPPALEWGDGNSFNPIMTCRAWIGMTMLDKYASGKTDENGEAVADSDTYVGYPYGGGVDFGFSLQKGKLRGEAKINTKYTCNDDGPDETTFSTPGVGVIYDISPDMLFWFGSGYDMHIANKGDCPPLASPADNGFRAYATGGGGMGAGVGFKGAFVGIFNQGYTKFPFGLTPNGEDDTDYTIPRIIASYATNPPYKIGASVQYQTKKLDVPLYDSDGDGVDDAVYPLDGKSIVTIIAGAQADLNIGAITFHAHGYYHQNKSDVGGPPGENAEQDMTDPSKIANTTGYGGNVAFAYKMGSMEPAAGFAYKVNSNDNWTKDDPEQAYFVRVKFDIAPGFNIQPGVVITDMMKGSSDQKQGKKTEFGVFLEAML